MRIAQWIWLAAVSGTWSAAGARADVVKLAELEANALTHRPEADMDRAAARRADAQVDQAETAYGPEVALGLQGSLSPGRQLLNLRDYLTGLDRDFLIPGSQGVEQPGAFVPQPRYGASITARGTLYDFGRTRAAVQAAVAAKRASEATGRARSESIVQEVRGAYVRWAVAHALYRIAEETRGRAERDRERTTGLIAEGAAPAADQNAALAQANAAAMDAARAALELESARLDLAYLTARDLGPEALPDPELLSAPPPSAAAAETDEAKRSEVALDAVEQARLAAEARVGMQAQSSSPVLGYQASAGVEGQTTFGIDNPQTYVFPSYALGVSLSVPLWDAGHHAAGEAAARAEVAELSARAAGERARDKHARARSILQANHATRLLELAQAGLSLADARVAQLASGPTLGSTDQARLAAAYVEQARAKAEVVRAQAALAQVRLGLM